MTTNIKSLVLITFTVLFPSLTQANALLLGIDVTVGGNTTARYTNIVYDREDGERSIDASNIGIFVNFKLPH